MIDKKGKRSAGAGRPKSTENEVAITARMPEDLRTKLNEAATSKGRSLSQEIQFRLQNTFTNPQKHGGIYGRLPGADDRNFALGLLVGEIAGRLETVTGEPWTKNEFTRATLLAAIDEVLARWKGDNVARPKRVQDNFKNVREPSDVASLISADIVFNLMLAIPEHLPSATDTDMEQVLTNPFARYAWYQRAFNGEE